VRAIANLTGELLRPKKLGGRTAARAETPLRRMPFFCTWRAISPKPQCARALHVMLMRDSDCDKEWLEGAARENIPV